MIGWKRNGEYFVVYDEEETEESLEYTINTIEDNGWEFFGKQKMFMTGSDAFGKKVNRQVPFLMFRKI